MQEHEFRPVPFFVPFSLQLGLGAVEKILYNNINKKKIHISSIFRSGLSLFLSI